MKVYQRATAIGIAMFGLMLAAQTAHAGGAAEIGGKASVTAITTVTTYDPDDGDAQTTLILGGLGAYTTQSGRFEFGAGLTIGALFSDLADVAIYQISGQARINSDPLGPEENLLVYLGAIVGVGIIRGDFDIDDEVGVFGPKIGAEFYVSPQTALQVQDAVLVDTESGVTNQLTLGIKFLF